MKLIIIGMFVALMALGTSCAQISQPVAEVAPQATSDGIKVHGHWSVTVTNPDGTVDAVHEFENALDGWGAKLLVQLLAGTAAISKDQMIKVGDANYPPIVGSELSGQPGPLYTLMPTDGWLVKLKPQNATAKLICKEGMTSTYAWSNFINSTYLIPTVKDKYTSDGTQKTEWDLRLSASCTVEDIDGGDTFEIAEVSTSTYAETNSSFGDAWNTFTYHVIPSDQPIIVEEEQIFGINIKISFE